MSEQDQGIYQYMSDMLITVNEVNRLTYTLYEYSEKFRYRLMEYSGKCFYDDKEEKIFFHDKFLKIRCSKKYKTKKEAEHYIQTLPQLF